MASTLLCTVTAFEGQLCEEDPSEWEECCCSWPGDLHGARRRGGACSGLLVTGCRRNQTALAAEASRARKQPKQPSRSKAAARCPKSPQEFESRNRMSKESLHGEAINSRARKGSLSRTKWKIRSRKTQRLPPKAGGVMLRLKLLSISISFA